MKLEKKYITPYLAYGLEGVVFVSKDIALDKVDIIGIVEDELRCNFKSEEYKNKSGMQKYFSLFEVKPILRPMSDLYQPLENGEVPIVELAKMADGEEWFLGDKPYYHKSYKWRGEQIGYAEREGGGYGKLVFSLFQGEFIIHANGYNKLFIENPIFLYQYLFEHHFDVFDLISKGIAIDINEIK